MWGVTKMTRRDGAIGFGVAPVWVIALAVLVGVMVTALVGCGNGHGPAEAGEGG